MKKIPFKSGSKFLKFTKYFSLPPLQGRVLLRPPKPQRKLGGGQPGPSWVSLRVSSWVWGRVFSCPRKRERFSRRKMRRAQDRFKDAYFHSKQHCTRSLEKIFEARFRSGRIGKNQQHVAGQLRTPRIAK